MFALFAPHTVTEKERHQAARTLFADGGGLADWPGPAAVLYADGGVSIANQAADALADMLGLGGDGDMEPALTAAIRAGHPTAVTLELEAGDGARYVFNVLPLVAGESALVLGRDTALENAFRDALTESRQRYKDLVEICGDFCWETGPDGCFVFVSPQGALGYGAEALVGRDPASLVDEVFADDTAFPFVTRTEIEAVDIWVRRADDGAACLETSALPVLDRDGAWCGARGVCRDVTVEREREAEHGRVQMRERLFAHITRAIRDEMDSSRLFDTAATAVTQALGAEGCELYGVDGAGAFTLAARTGQDGPDDTVAAGCLARARGHDGVVDVSYGDKSMLCIATSFHHAVNGALALWRAADGEGWTADDRALVADVAIQIGVAIEQTRARIALETLSRTDGLTGLLNQRAFTAELDQRLARASRGDSSGALFYVDLDNFKPVNDLYGHQKGDEALMEVARLLRDHSRPGDLVARLGGDEFALWLDRTDEDAARARATILLKAAQCLAPFSGAPDQPLGISVGVAVWRSGNNESLDALTLRADAAMYEIKNLGKNGYVIACSADVDFDDDGDRRDSVSA
ncbi:MAG: diguanylate cyclase [Alphaproteobacteria bacterium]